MKSKCPPPPTEPMRTDGRHPATRNEKLSKVIFWIIAIFFLLITYGSRCFGQNFTGAEKVYLERAEKARKELAIFWTGKELPGDWSKPCSIKIKEYPPGRPAWETGGGFTKFSFDQGQVYGWRMELEGPRNLILESVIPHEVSHMIFASIVRRPIPRWLDEGCSSLFESKYDHERLRKQTRDDNDRYGTMLKNLDVDSYSSSMKETLKVYAAGYTLVEWMLYQRGKETLFEFVKDPDLPSVKMEKYYGMKAGEALRQWSSWIGSGSFSCDSSSCLMHSHHYVAKPLLVASNREKPILYIVGTSWCIKCKSFEFAFFGFDTRFRKALESKYTINWVNGDVYRQWVADHGVIGYPSYIVSNRDSMVTEFRSKSKFMEALANLPLKEQSVVKQESVPAPNPSKEKITPDPPKEKAPMPSSYIRKKDVETIIKDAIKHISASAQQPVFDQEGFKNDLFEKLESDRNIQRSEFGAIEKNTQESNTRSQKAIDLATAAVPTALELLGYGGVVGATGLATGGTGWLAILGVRGLLRLRRRRKERKQLKPEDQNWKGPGLDIGPMPTDDPTKNPIGESDKTDKIMDGLQETIQDWDPTRSTIPSVNKVYADINEENRQLKEVIKEQQNENSKMRNYVQVPIQTNTELYREALDIVAKTYHASPTFQLFHKEVEEHFKLLLSGRGV